MLGKQSPVLQNTIIEEFWEEFIIHVISRFKGRLEGAKGRNKGMRGKKQTKEEEREATKSHHSILPKVTERLNKDKYIAQDPTAAQGQSQR